MDTNALLEQGIAALKAGQKAEARRLLERAVQQDKDNETAWLWLSGAVDVDHERIYCLRETLRINPNNQHARRGLETLEKAPTPRPVQPVERKLTPPPPTAGKKKHDIEPIQVAEKPPPDDTKQCPYCAETINVEAIICRFCGRALNATITTSSTIKQSQTETNLGRLLMGIGALGLIIGAILPWAIMTAPLIGTVSIAGYEGDGIISGAIGLLLFIGAAISKGKPGKVYSIAGAIFGLLAGVVVFPKLFSIGAFVAEVNVRASIGPGIYLSLTGIVLVIVGGLRRVPSPQ